MIKNQTIRVSPQKSIPNADLYNLLLEYSALILNLSFLAKKIIRNYFFNPTNHIKPRQMSSKSSLQFIYNNDNFLGLLLGYCINDKNKNTNLEKFNSYTNRRNLFILASFLDLIVIIMRIFLSYRTLTEHFMCSFGFCALSFISLFSNYVRIFLLVDDLVKMNRPCQYHNFNITIYVIINCILCFVMTGPRCLLAEPSNPSYCYSKHSINLHTKFHGFATFMYLFNYFGISLCIAYRFYRKRRKIDNSLNVMIYDHIIVPRFTNMNSRINASKVVKNLRADKNKFGWSIIVTLGRDVQYLVYHVLYFSLSFLYIFKQSPNIVKTTNFDYYYNMSLMIKRSLIILIIFTDY
ncbi:unnamed protein product [Gordionus sp. m RMFG-2023]